MCQGYRKISQYPSRGHKAKTKEQTYELYALFKQEIFWQKKKQEIRGRRGNNINH